MKPSYQRDDVKIIQFPRTRVAVLEHRGDPTLLGDSIRRFIEWRKKHHYPRDRHALYNVFYNSPYDTPPEEFRIDLCCSIDSAIPRDSAGIVEKDLPEGRCAVLRHVGTDDTLGDSFSFLYASWLPASGEEPRDFPPFCRRVRFPPEVPEHEAVTDLFLPLQG